MSVPSVEEMEDYKPLIERLSKDMKEAAKLINRQEARFLVGAYYQIQGDRIVTNNRVKAMDGEPHAVLEWLLSQNKVLERQIGVSLDVYSYNHPVGLWLRSICGIGPVIAAGFLAHLDITKAPAAANFWTFAGLDPTISWEKGKKRPWNADLKTLCYKVGESFVYTQNRDKDFYGKLFVTRKQKEIAKNLNGEFAEQAEAALKKFKFGRDTAAYASYSTGKLPAAHIHARARRWTVKIFLSHVHYVMYIMEYNKEPELPFKNFIEPPGDLPEKVRLVYSDGVYKTLNR